MAVDAIINAVKLRNAGKAVEKVPIQNKLTRSLAKVKRLYQKLTNNLASRAPLLTRYIELISICLYGLDMLQLTWFSSLFSQYFS